MEEKWFLASHLLQYTPTLQGILTVHRDQIFWPPLPFAHPLYKNQDRAGPNIKGISPTGA